MSRHGKAHHDADRLGAGDLSAALAQALEEGRGRKAASLWKQLRHAEATGQDAAVLQYCVARARQAELRRAGLMREADDLPVIRPSDAEIVGGTARAQALYARYAPLLDSVAVVGEQQASAGLREAQVARWMLAHAESGDDIPPERLGAADGEAMQAARAHMREGAWAQAQQCLAGEGRASALAVWRLFARAMAAHLDGRAEEASRCARQALERSPHFPLRRVLDSLSGIEQAPPVGVAAVRQRDRVDACLHWQSQMRESIEERAAELRDGRFVPSRWVQGVHALAMALSPVDSAQAVRELFFLFLPEVKSHERAKERLLDAAGSGRVPGTGRVLRMHLHFLACDTMELVSQSDLVTAFVEAAATPGGPRAQNTLGQAHVLTYVAEHLYKAAVELEVTDDDDAIVEVLLQVAGTQLADALDGGAMDEIIPPYLRVLAVAIEADSADVERSRLFARWAGQAEQTPPLIRLRHKMLGLLRRSVPDEPFSYAQVARLHHDEGAFATAVKVAARGRARWPDDPEFGVLEGLARARAALTGQVSAAEAQRFLAWVSQSGEAIEPRIRPLMQISRLALTLDIRAAQPKELEQRVKDLSPLAAVRVLALVTFLTRRPLVRRSLVAICKRRAAELSAQDVETLVCRGPDELRRLTQEAAPMTAALVPVAAVVLPRLSDEALLAKASVLFAAEATDALETEVRRRRRLRRDAPPDAAFLADFLALCGRPAPKRLHALVDSALDAPGEARYRLCSAAGELAAYAPEPCRLALHRLPALRTRRQGET